MEELEKQILKELIDYANNQSHTYLSRRTDYAKGYYDGVTRVKEIILEITEKIR